MQHRTSVRVTCMAVAGKQPTFSGQKKLVKPHAVLQQVSFYTRTTSLTVDIAIYISFLDSGNRIQPAVRNQESCLLPVAKGPCFGLMKRYAFNMVWVTFSVTEYQVQTVWISRRRTGVNYSLTVAAKVMATISQLQINASRLVAVHCPV